MRKYISELNQAVDQLKSFASMDINFTMTYRPENGRIVFTFSDNLTSTYDVDGAAPSDVLWMVARAETDLPMCYGRLDDVTDECYFIINDQGRRKFVDAMEELKHIFEDDDHLDEYIDEPDDAIFLLACIHDYGNLDDGIDVFKNATRLRYYGDEKADIARGRCLVDNDVFKDFDHNSEMANYFDFESYGIDMKQLGWSDVEMSDGYIFYFYG